MARQFPYASQSCKRDTTVGRCALHTSRHEAPMAPAGRTACGSRLGSNMEARQPQDLALSTVWARRWTWFLSFAQATT